MALWYGARVAAAHCPAPRSAPARWRGHGGDQAGVRVGHATRLRVVTRCAPPIELIGFLLQLRRSADAYSLGMGATTLCLTPPMRAHSLPERNAEESRHR